MTTAKTRNAVAGGLGTKIGRGSGAGGGKQGRGFLQMLEGQPGTPRGLQRRREGLRRASSACPIMWASGINHLVYKLGKDETRFALP